MKKLNLKLRRSGSVGLFHDSRADSLLLMNAVNTLQDAVNKLIDENNVLKERIGALEVEE